MWLQVDQLKEEKTQLNQPQQQRKKTARSDMPENQVDPRRSTASPASKSVSRKGSRRGPSRGASPSKSPASRQQLEREALRADS